MFIHFKSKVCVDGPTEVCNPPICADGPRTILNPGMANDFMSGQGAVPIGPRILGNEGNAGLTKAGFDIVEFDGQNSTFVDWKSIMNDPFNLDLIANAKRTRRFLESKTTGTNITQSHHSSFIQAVSHGLGGPRSGELTAPIPGIGDHHFGGGHFSGSDNTTRPKRSMDYHIDDIISTGPYKLAVPLKSALKFTESTKWNQAEINIIRNDEFPNNGKHSCTEKITRSFAKKVEQVGLSLSISGTAHLSLWVVSNLLI